MPKVQVPADTEGGCQITEIYAFGEDGNLRFGACGFVPEQTVGALARGGVQEVRSNHQLDTQSRLDGEGEADIWINVRYLALETDPKNTHTAQ